MSKVFGYPEYDEKGEKILTTYDNEYKAMMMDIRVYRMKSGETRTFLREGEETAVLLLSGNITYKWNEITVVANAESQILVQCTKNEKDFGAKLYKPEDAPWGYSCVGKFGNVAKRRVNTIFDHDISPESNMVLGEVLNDRGNWSGYLPHRHPQPETYFFKFDHPEGFGASFVGDQVFKSTDESFSAIPGGATLTEIRGCRQTAARMRDIPGFMTPSFKDSEILILDRK